MRSVFVCLPLFLALGVSGVASAQSGRSGPGFDSSAASKWSVPGGRNPALEFYQRKLGKPFGLQGRQSSADGKSIDFSNLARPVFVFFGYYGCHPCMHELPVFIESANEHPEIDFVYVTYDNEAIRRKEFEAVGKKAFKPGANFFIIQMHDEEIYRSGLTWGYPTKYFLEPSGLVRYVQSGGNTAEPVASVKARFARIINGD